MRFVYLAFFILFQIFFVNGANAGGISPPVHEVGRCGIYHAFTLPIKRDLAIFDNFTFQVLDVTPTNQLFASTPKILNKDPMNQVFGFIPGAYPGHSVFIDWYGNLVVIVPNMPWQIIGKCTINPAFASAQLVPPPAPPTPATHELTFDCKETGNNCDFDVPEALIDFDNAYVPTLIANEKIAADCKTYAENNDEEGFYNCMVPKMMGKKEQEYYKCMQDNDGNDAALCVLKSGVGQNEKKYIDVAEGCYKKHNTRYNEWPSCVAKSPLVKDPELRTALNCITSSSKNSGQIDYMGAGVCFVGSKFDMNNESIIIVKCAAYTRGQPHAFATCAGGELMIAEVDKCLEKGIGGDGCFGKGNTVMQYRDKVEAELKKKFGNNSPIVAYWNTVTYSPGQSRQAVRELNKALKVLRNPGSAATSAMNEVGKGVNGLTKGIESAGQSVGGAISSGGNAVGKTIKKLF